MTFNHRKFLAYHPYLTFSDPLNTRFIQPDGKQGDDLNADTAALFFIGKEAYKRLPRVQSRENFDHAFSSYFEFIKEQRASLQEMESTGKLKYKTLNGSEIKADWSNADDSQILNVTWQIVSKNLSKAEADVQGVYTELNLFHALIEIDHAIIGMFMDGSDAICAAIEAANALSNALAIETGSERLQEVRRDMAYRGAIARIERDPKQKEKTFIFECWQKWQQLPTSYPSKAAFARDMLTKCEHLTSQKKIEDWCREWENAHSAG